MTRFESIFPARRPQSHFSLGTVQASCLSRGSKRTESNPDSDANEPKYPHANQISSTFTPIDQTAVLINIIKCFSDVNYAPGRGGECGGAGGCGGAAGGTGGGAGSGLLSLPSCTLRINEMNNTLATRFSHVEFSVSAVLLEFIQEKFPAVIPTLLHLACEFFNKSSKCTSRHSEPGGSREHPLGSISTNEMSLSIPSGVPTSFAET
ncbi:unnamed protein product [Colias eurytheme]|nr:unnamed protein product [Colias eurytheme]